MFFFNHMLTLPTPRISAKTMLWYDYSHFSHAPIDISLMYFPHLAILNFAVLIPTVSNTRKIQFSCYYSNQSKTCHVGFKPLNNCT